MYPSYLVQIFDIVERRKQNTYLCHDFPAYRQVFSDLIKECAILENWPVEHRFSGTHMFRHGAAQDAFDEGGLDLVVLRTGHLSAKAAREYARSDAERNQLAKFKKLDKAAKEAYLTEMNREAMKRSEETFRTKTRSYHTNPHFSLGVRKTSNYIQ